MKVQILSFPMVVVSLGSDQSLVRYNPLKVGTGAPFFHPKMDVILSHAVFIKFSHADLANHTYTHTPNMGRKKNAAAPRTKNAARLLFQCPSLTTSEAMKAADFSTEEAKIDNNK